MSYSVIKAVTKIVKHPILLYATYNVIVGYGGTLLIVI